MQGPSDRSSLRGPLWQTRKSPTPFAQFHRPVMLGVSVGHPKGTVGSVGPFVILPNGRPGFLSASFVLAPAGASIGDWVHQPGPYDAALLTGATRVGRLAGIAVPTANDVSGVAAAVVELVGADMSGNVVPQIAGHASQVGRLINDVAGIDDIVPGDEVALLGCTSGYSQGRITAVDCAVDVAGYKFGGAFEITADDGQFSAPGDAGGLIYRCSDMKALGLLFARSNMSEHRSVSLALPLQPALDALGVALLSQPVTHGQSR